MDVAMRIDLLTLDDLSAALRLSTLAGWNQLEQDWRRLIELYPDSCFAGRVDGQLVATATLATYSPQIEWVGMMLVDPAHRHRGHATSMMRHVLEHARRRNVVILGLDASDDARPLYLKLGFKDYRPIHRLRRPPMPGARRLDVPDPTEEDGAAKAPDREFAPALHRRDLLQRLRSEPTSRAFVSGKPDSGRPDWIDGYCIRRPGRTAAYLGPLFAKNAAAFDDLLSAALPDHEPTIADAWDPNVVDILERHGFRIVRTLTRMFRPFEPAVIDDDGVLRLAAAFELG